MFKGAFFMGFGRVAIMVKNAEEPCHNGAVTKVEAQASIGSVSQSVSQFNDDASGCLWPRAERLNLSLLDTEHQLSNTGPGWHVQWHGIAGAKHPSETGRGCRELGKAPCMCYEAIIQIAY